MTYAVVVTHNRERLLVRCLAALAAQTHDLTGVLVVDCASSDNTLAALEAGDFGTLPVEYLRLERNGGGAEGFHYGIGRARERDCDWIWAMDDDCEPEPDALRLMLESDRARDPEAVLLAPLAVTGEGELLPLARGWLRRRWFFAPLVGLSPSHASADEVEVEHVSLVGPLVRTAVARAEEPPRRDFFIWYDDLEWVSRLRRHGSAWLLPAARIAHHDQRPLTDAGLRARWRDFRRGHRFEDAWKRCYGLRNLIYCGLRDGFVTRPQAASHVAVAAVRALLFERPPRRSLWAVVRYGRDGWRGRFLNLPPDRWPGLATAPSAREYVEHGALAYDRDVAGEVRTLGGRSYDPRMRDRPSARR